MVAFLDVNGMRAWVNRTGPEEIVRNLVGYLREDFLRWPESADPKDLFALVCPTAVAVTG